MKTIAVHSLKGGVGKTTLAVNLAWCATALSARRTLLWDLDPQAAATYLLAVPGRRQDQAQAAFTKAVDLGHFIQPTAIDRLALISADASLRGLDLIFHSLDKKRRLAKLIEALEDGHDRLLLDCPPGLNETGEQVARAADLIVVPVTPSPLSTRTVDEVSAFHERHGRKGIRILPVHSMVDRRRRLHRDAVARHPDWPIIPMASLIETMGEHRAPIGQFAARTTAAKAFADVWRAIERALADTG